MSAMTMLEDFDDSRVVLHLDLDCFCAFLPRAGGQLCSPSPRVAALRLTEILRGRKRFPNRCLLLLLLLLTLCDSPTSFKKIKKKIEKTDCQVESQRLRLDPAAPLAVRQWQGLIAVNYAAREAGVTRHMTAAEALKICPTIALAHVETLGEGGASDGGSVVFGGGAGGAGGGGGGGGGQQFVPRKSQRKASLLRYRDASARVLQALRSFFPPGTVVEKASIDEFYVDATAAAEAMLRPENGGCAVGVCEAAARAPGGAVVVEGFFEKEEEEEEEEKGGGGGGGEGSSSGGGKALSSSSSSALSLDPTNPLDARLAAGAALASGARALILRETGYTLSAGISHNKLLSKIASARFKPNRQAVVPRRGAPPLLRRLPLSKLPGFGGKLGAAVTAATGAETAGDVAALPLDALKAAFRGSGDGGDAAALSVFRAVRGESGAPVVEKAAPKSLMAAKSLDVATNSRQTLEKWLSILADELATRLEADGRPPRTLALHFRCRGMVGTSSERSVSGPAPRAMRRPVAAAAGGGEGGGGGDKKNSSSNASSSVAVAVPPDAGAIAAAAGVLLTRAMNAAAAAAASGGGGGGAAGAPWPLCNRLSLVAGDFAPPRATGAASIASFFTSSAASPAKTKEKELAEEEVVEDDDQEEKVAVVGEEEEKEEELMPPPPPPPPVPAPATAAAAAAAADTSFFPERQREGEEAKQQQEEEDLLSTVDVREQERILREIERGRGGGASGSAGAGGGGGGGRGGGSSGSGARGGGGGGKGRGGGGGKKRDAASAALPDSKQRSIAAMFGRGKSAGGK